MELTQREQQALDFIKEMVSVRGYPPSIREIAELFGNTGPAHAQGVLVRLEEKGAIEREANKPRAIRVLV